MLYFGQVTGKCENHRVSLEQSLSWGEPRCIHQLYGQMIIWTSFLSGCHSVLPLLYDSEDRLTFGRFGKGRRLCSCRRLSLCFEAHTAAAGLCSSHGISCPSQLGCYLASQQFEECCSSDTAAWRCSVERGKLPQHLGHSCIYTAQKTNKEKCSGAQSFST